MVVLEFGGKGVIVESIAGVARVLLARSLHEGLEIWTSCGRNGPGQSDRGRNHSVKNDKDKVPDNIKAQAA